VLFSLPGLVAGLLQSTMLFWLLMTMTMLLLPASVMLLAIEERFFSAINPLALIDTALRIGLPYLLLWLFLMLFSAGAGQIAMVVAPGVDVGITLFVYNFATLYFSVAMFHLMGYVVFQFHEPLGFSIDRQVVVEASNPGVAATLDPIQILITEGRLDEAVRELETRLRQNLADLPLHERFNRLLITVGDKARGVPHADLYIGRLVAAGQAGQALDVYRRSVTPLGRLDITDAKDVMVLARLAGERHESRLVLALLARFEQRFPGHVLVPEAQLLAARMLCEHAGRDDLAARIVENLLRTHAQHPLRPQMENLMKLVEGLRQRRALQGDQAPLK